MSTEALIRRRQRAVFIVGAVLVVSVLMVPVLVHGWAAFLPAAVTAVAVVALLAWRAFIWRRSPAIAAEAVTRAAARAEAHLAANRIWAGWRGDLP